MSVNKTKIEWTDFTWNPLTGCKHNCPYCYAKKIGMRFDGHFNPTFHPERLNDKFPKKPSKIFVCSMADLFGDWIPDKWIIDILRIAYENPQHTFQYLTKNPKRMQDFIFPYNAWIGTTIEDKSKLYRLEELQKVKAPYKFISFEPLLGKIDIDLTDSGIDLVIIGGLTGTKEKTKKEWDKIKHPNKFYKSNFI